MEKYITKIFLVACIVIGGVTATTFAQQGGCPAGGSIGYNQYVNYTGAASGDQTVTAAGTIEIGPNGVYDVYGAIINGGNVIVNNGGVLNVYGNFVNNGTLKVAPGGTINYYGASWTNAATASVTDNAAAANNNPGGDVNFIAPRPTVPASFMTSAPCLSAYSGGDALQMIDGGNVPMDISLHQQNANNIMTMGSNTKIEGELVFDVVDGDVDLGNNDFIFTANGDWSSNVAPNEAFILTNGTVACAGHVEKEGLGGFGASSLFAFPIGRAETYSGGRDYTPALLLNVGAADNYQVGVKSYADAVSIGGVVIAAPQEGMDRVWQITSTNGSGITMNLQHNSTTNGVDYTSVFGGDEGAFITQYQGDGVWDVSTSGSYIAGDVSGSAVHARGFSVTTTATDCSDNNSWFTKSNDTVSPLPIRLKDFTAQANGCDVILKWSTAMEVNAAHFIIETSTDGRTYSYLTQVEAKNSADGASYSYTKKNAAAGKSFYRLQLVDMDRSSLYSNVVTATTDCDGNRKVDFYPNPATSFLKVEGLQAGDVVVAYNSIGQMVVHTKANSSNLNIDLSAFATGHYVFSVINNGNTVQVVKVSKTK